VIEEDKHRGEQRYCHCVLAAVISAFAITFATASGPVDVKMKAILE
jgi:hypothetical protein